MLGKAASMNTRDMVCVGNGHKSPSEDKHRHRCLLTGSKRIVVLHAFVKKSRHTPDRELTVARTRLKRLQDG